MEKNIDNIKDKIKKLMNVTLDNGATENEVQVALMKARKLLMEYKLEERDVLKGKDIEIVHSKLNHVFSSVNRPWLVNLMNILADRHCCFFYCKKAYRAKTRQMWVSGEKDDVQILSSVLDYCVDTIIKLTNKWLRENPVPYRDAAYEHKVTSNIALGFCKGLEVAYAEQDEQNQEWGLVAVVPEEAIIKNLATDHMEPRSYGSHESYYTGYNEGYNVGSQKRMYGNQIGE